MLPPDDEPRDPVQPAPKPRRRGWKDDWLEIGERTEEQLKEGLKGDSPEVPGIEPPAGPFDLR